jgi:uncharacterized membrane protein YdjX (TVP38/TMEM64 family)
MKNGRNLTLLSFLLFTILPLFSSSIISYFVLQYQSTFQSFTYSQWLLVSLLLAVSSACALSPPTFLAVIYGYFIGFLALPFLFVINFGAILLVFLFCGWADLRWIETYFQTNEKANNILEKLKKEELKIVFFTKLSPVLPFALTNLLFGVSGAKLRNILIGGFLGMMPRTALAVYTGMQAKEINILIQNPNSGLFSKIVVFGLVVFSVWGIIFSVKKAFSKQ